MELYIVERESSDGLETDIFANYELAKEWANHIGEKVRTEETIDRKTLDLLKNCTEKINLEDEQEEDPL